MAQVHRPFCGGKMVLNVAIVGAGVGGLAAATLLAGQGHTVHLFDQFDTPRPVGSGLVIQPVGQAVLARLGALGHAQDNGARVFHMLGLEADSGRRVLDVHYGPSGGDSYGLAIHRAALFEALMQALPPKVTLHTARRCIGRKGQVLEFADASRAGPFDLIVDASGAGSHLSPLKARLLPYGAIWGWVDWSGTGLDPTMLHQRYRRADRMVGILPIGQVPGERGQKAAIFWSLPQDGHPAWLDKGVSAWREEASALWPDFAPFAEQITDPNQMTMARYSHGTLVRPVGDGIAHIGDSAHRASPQLGQGANMALLDALALAEGLRLSRGDVGLGLMHYARARRWHVWTYQAMSRAFTPQYQSDSRVLPWLRDRVLFPASQISPIPRVLTRLVRGDMLPPLASLTPLDGL